MSRALLERILVELPAFLRGDSEISQLFPNSKALSGPIVQNILNKVPACYGVDPELAGFLFDFRT
jgi:hypothetical protein